jgi:hypothetical protein
MSWDLISCALKGFKLGIFFFLSFLLLKIPFIPLQDGTVKNKFSERIKLSFLLCQFCDTANQMHWQILVIIR